MRVPTAVGTGGAVGLDSPVRPPLLDAASDVSALERPAPAPFDLLRYSQHQTASSRRRVHAARPSRAMRMAPLSVILVVQACLALRLVWANTAFSDESLYLWAGHLEWAHWLHGSPVPAFPTYFSGAPVIYPPLGALADSLGGLMAARLLSLCFMLGTTALLYAVTSKLFGRRAAACGAAVFAVLGPVQFLSAFATYDAMAIFLIALATWFAIRAKGNYGEVFLIATGLTLALADATKYASVLWTPVVILIMALTAPGPGRLRPAFRALRVTAYVGGPLLFSLLAFGGSAYIQGVMFTTLARQADSTYASALTVLSDSFSWIGLVFLLAVAGTVVSFFVRDRARWLCLVLTVAVVLAPIHQAQIHTTTSLHKHVAFGAWFGAIVAGYLLAKAAEVNPIRGWKVGAVAAGLTLFIAVPQATNMFIYGWPNTSGMNADLAAIIPRAGCPCMIAQQSQVRYYLANVVAHKTIVGPFSFWYWSRQTHQELHGLPAYEQAIRDHYFSVVEIDPAENNAIYKPIVRTLESTTAYRLQASLGYQLQASIPIDHWGRRTMEIWSDLREARP